nr:retrovirus-related Pol polyprotein from transposon TNT 1-94 [Tanacetum cinerariifolium]
ILPVESQRNTTDPSVTVTDSSATDYHSADESSVCSTPLPPLKKLDGDEPISGPKTIKSILRSIKHEKYTLVIVNEYSRYTWVYFLKKKSQAPETIMSFIKRVQNQNDIKVKQLRTDNVYIHNHKDHLGKFNEKADDGYLLGYSLVYKAFRVFNTRRQQTEETYHIIFDESPDAIKFSTPLFDNINIAENERYLPDGYLHPYEPS